MKYEEKVQKVKQELIAQLDKNEAIAITGRVRSWLTDDESRYPVSCTVTTVEDSMEGEKGIEDSWLFTSKGLRYAAGVTLDLSQLRPKDTDNGRGLIASGAASFVKIYSVLNEVLRRGGKFKNGAVVAYLDAKHPDMLDFINLNGNDIPWVKRALYVDDDLLLHPHLEAIMNAVRNGTLWLAKKRYDSNGQRLYSNVCMEILLPDRGTCLLSHVNLGKCTIRNLRKNFKDSMRFLCKLHKITGAGRDNFYLSPKVDKQVGLGVIGLANLLARYRITYAQFADCLYEFLTAVTEDISLQAWKDTYPAKVTRLVQTLCDAFDDAAEIAKRYGMNRAFTVAPTATCSFNAVDYKGYTTTAEISPPICHPKTKVLTRDSSTFGTIDYQYPKNVETAEQVGFQTYYKLVKAWQLLMESTGLAHAISFNTWIDGCEINREFLQDWLDSPLVTMYYRLKVAQDFADKTDINVGLDESVFSETDGFATTDNATDSLIVGIPSENITDDFLSRLKQLTASSTIVTDDEDVKICAINKNPGEYCEPCGE